MIRTPFDPSGLRGEIPEQGERLDEIGLQLLQRRAQGRFISGGQRAADLVQQAVDGLPLEHIRRDRLCWELCLGKKSLPGFRLLPQCKANLQVGREAQLLGLVPVRKILGRGFFEQSSMKLWNRVSESRK